MNRTMGLGLLMLASLALCLLTGASCNKKSNNTGEGEKAELKVSLPSPFSADSALKHVAAQVAYGPRVPNSEAHKETATYLASRLEEYGMKVIRQEATLEAYDGTQLQAVNIIGQYKPEAKNRVLLFAHWDTRPYADYDPDPAKRKEPIDGADDGASGPGVLLEIARLLQSEGGERLKNIGVDIIFFDAEDYGVPAWEHSYSGKQEETWALGTQYWTRHPHRENYRADFGILLDMVGAKGATFYREYFSQEFAGKYVTKIWQVADALGHGDYFINKMGGAVTDDHYFVIKNAKIPCVDIINYDPSSRKGFGSHWHTHADTLENIDTNTLQAVGEVVWQVLLSYATTL